MDDRRGRSKPVTWDVDAATGCWNVTSHALDKKGYPVITIKRRTTLLHRYTYEQTHGPIPDGLCVCHSCDNRRCVNPAHLWLGTQKANIHDMMDKGRRSNPQGASHYRAKLTEENVRYIREHTEMTGRELARMLNVSDATICNIRHGRKWQHLQD